ncbi:MAG TPA: hypothetical protein VE053_11300 [Allosphingosinicella sp.]|nr:hypothetical protein [Allosphingosinicella sp.]
MKTYLAVAAFAVALPSAAYGQTAPAPKAEMACCCEKMDRKMACCEAHMKKKDKGDRAGSDAHKGHDSH